MAGIDRVTEQADVEANETAPATRAQKDLAARRKFMGQALAVTSGIALSELLPSSLLKAASQATCPTSPPAALVPVTEITRNGNKLQAVMQVINGTRAVPTSTTATTPAMLRYYKGHNPDPAKSSESWPPPDFRGKPGPPGPGPTFRCEIGDIVQITFLNQVNVAAFPGSLANGDFGTANGCDQATNVLPTGTNKNWYPAEDTFPNCLHASSAANIHFHGTHVTPSTTGDNVLVNIWPNTKVTENDVQRAFGQIFAHCDLGHEPKKWADLPLGWRLYQERLIKEYDATAPYVGPGANPNGHGLPVNLQLWPQNAKAIAQGVWPQYYVGSYPYCYQIPKYDGSPTGVKMGQAPGTHWYHSHKHGSTTINMFNGLSGAFIIEDNSATGYDGGLKGFYSKTGNKLEQVVLVFQQITAAPNLLSSGQPPPGVLVNGQFTPTITMRPGQVLLFRMINATVQKFLIPTFQPCAGTATLAFKQTAQDGVQFSPANYTRQPTTANLFNIMSPANRIDLLVQAPATTGLHAMQNAKAAPILYVNVTGDPINPPMPFPSESDIPPLPKFLGDILDDEIFIQRRVVYGWEPQVTNPPQPGRNATTGASPKYMIDGKQFEDNIINQVMRLDTAEEWTIYNETTGAAPGQGAPPIRHPFHIHVNPFQIVEIFDPWTMDKPTRLVRDLDAAKKKYGNTRTLVQGSPLWWDTFGIPAGKIIDGTLVPGYFTMRTRFVDFTGQYVQHCHILSHEDRGMMQLLEVVSNKTVTKHH
jgi:FtsP/CotA-like multicopper oxidase with cupredoxin domain